MQTEDKGPMDQLSAHLDRGWDLVARGDFPGALMSAEKSLELDAESPEAHNLLGYIYAAEGHAEEALDHYQKAVELDESFVEAMLNAAEVLIHPLGDFEGAVHLVEDALDFVQDDDETADAMLLKVDALLHMGRREDAAGVLATMPEGPFDNPQIDFMIGRALFEIGDLDGAGPRIERAVERDPNLSESQYYLGLLLEARSDARGATVAFLESRHIDLRMPPPPWALPNDQFEQRVQSAIRKLAEALQDRIEGALVVVGDVPGAEVVAEGVDPRVLVLLDDVTDKEGTAHVGRIFVYQRNVERMASGVIEVEEEILDALAHELLALFPELGPPATAPAETASDAPPPKAESGADGSPEPDDDDHAA